MKNTKINQKGITIIALVITIVVLLILAGVSIAMLTGENGILKQATNAKIQTIKAEEKEQIALAYTMKAGEKLKNGDESIVTASDLKEAFDENKVEAEAEPEEDTENIIVTFTKTKNKYKIDTNGKITEIAVAEVPKQEEKVYGYANDWEYKDEDKSITYIGSWSSEKGDTFVIPNYWKENESSTEEKKVVKIAGLNSSIKNATGIKLKITDGIEEIGDKAFHNYPGFVGDLVIPHSVKVIGSNAFYNCRGFNGDLIIGDGVTSIGNYAFHNCTGFTGKMVIGKSVTSFGEYAVYNLSTLFTGDLIIKTDTLLASMIGGNNVSDRGNKSAFSSLKLEGNPKVIPENMFNGCTGIKGQINIPNSVETIENRAFNNCKGFTGDLIIPNNVKTLGEYAFGYCSGLDGDLVIGDGVTSVSNYAFYNCSGFTGKMVIGKSVTSFGEYAVYNLSTLFTGDLIIKTDTLLASMIGGSNVSDRGNKSAFSSLKLEGNPKVIPENMFNGCTGIKGQINIPNSVETIEKKAFCNCRGFTGDLIIPNNVKTLREYAFGYCSGLDGDLVIGDGVTTIDNYVFYNCEAFTGKMVIGKSITNFSSYTFYRFSKLFTGDLVIRCENCKSLQSALVKDNAFNNIVIEDMVLTIEADAFKNINAATGILKINKAPDSIEGKPWGWKGNVEWQV